MNTKSIGNIGEAKAIMKFTELGIPVYLPFGENERADMIIDLNGELLKIQVKTSTVYKDGGTKFTLCCSRGHKEIYKTIYTEDDIDYFVLYSIPTDEMYMIHVNDTPNTSIFIRNINTNIKCTNINNSNDYLINNVIEQLTV